MISFFRKIRQALLRSNTVTRYLAYAIGEIILVVIGILIALQVNNWNEEQRRKEAFFVTVEQIYNVLEIEKQALDFMESHLLIQGFYNDSLFNYSDRIDPRLVPGILNYQESAPSAFQTSLLFLLQNLNVKPGHSQEIRLARNLTDYVSLAKLDFSSSELTIKEVLIREGIPTPELNFGITINQKTLNLENLINQEEIEKSNKLLKSPEVRTALIKSSVLKSNQIAKVFHVREVAEQLQAQIKQQYPQVKLLYENLGIIGTGTLAGDWLTDLPLHKIDGNRSLWEAEVELQEGGIKFRENAAWSRNWGGKTFPKGDLEWEGPNIQVSAGLYKIRLDLSAKTYEFLPISK